MQMDALVMCAVEEAALPTAEGDEDVCGGTDDGSEASHSAGGDGDGAPKKRLRADE